MLLHRQVVLTTWPALIAWAWYSGENYLGDEHYGTQIWTSWALMTLNLPLGLAIIAGFPLIYGFLVFSLIWELYHWDDDRMFGEWSEIFTNDLIPYP